jgi:ribonuclease Y
MDRLEQRESALNKRQSVIDKRANELDKKFEQQVLELQRIAQMSMEDAHNELLAVAEKEAQADMAYHPPD